MRDHVREVQGTVDVDDRAARQLGHVVVDSSALPAGAATEATLGTVRDRLPAGLVGGRLDVNVGASVLPTGAATEATLANVAKEGAAITGEALEAGGSSVLGWLSSLRSMLRSVRDRLPAGLVGGRLPVDVGATVGLTDAQLRATAVPVSGPLTDAQLRATAVPVSGPLTDAQLRAVAVAISHANLPNLDLALTALRDALTKTGINSASLRDVYDRLAAPLSVTGPLTDAQLRAAAVAISAAALPLPAGAATDAVLQAARDRIGEVSATPTANTLQDRLKALLAAVDGVEALLNGGLPAVLVGGRLDTNVGATVGITDAQLRATAVPVSGPLTDTQLRALAVAISAAALPLPAGAATEATLADLEPAAAWKAPAAITTVDATVQTLPAQAAKHGVVVLCDPDGSASALVGDVDPPNFKLIPGATMRIPVSNANLVKFKRAAAANVTIYHYVV